MDGYSYDAENRIIEVQQGSASGAVLATYEYGADGQRVHRTGVTTDTCDSAGVRDYIYDLAGHWILEVNNGGTYCKGEIYAAGRHYATDADGNSIFDHSDWLGTVRLRNSYQYPSSFETCGSLPFGDALTCTGSDQSTIHFTAKERDSESGLDNFGARFDSSSIGRFMTPDQLGAGQHPGNPQSWNLYSYVQNNPLNLTDPTGEYVCGSTLNQEQCTNFQKNLDTAQTAANNLKDKYGEDSEQYQSAERAIDAYGKAGVDNGVTIQVGKTGDYGANTSVAGTTGPKTADNPTGQQITVTFNQNQLNKVSDFNALLEGHEGVHVANGSDWVLSGFSNNANPSHYQDEFDAYVVSAHIAEGLGYSTYGVSFGNRNYPLFNSAWSGDAQNLAITTIINKEYPKNQLDAFSRNTKPKPR